MVNIIIIIIIIIIIYNSYEYNLWESGLPKDCSPCIYIQLTHTDLSVSIFLLHSRLLFSKFYFNNWNSK